MGVWSILEDIVVAGTISWVVWVVFSSVRRYLIGRTKAALQEKILQRIDSAESLVALTGSEAGRRFLEGMMVEETQRGSPSNRILFGVQAGIVLIFFGIAMLFLHHHTADPEAGFMIAGTGAIGFGLGFLIAAGASIVVSQKLGLLGRAPRG